MAAIWKKIGYAAKCIRDSGYFDEAHYLEALGKDIQGIDAAEHYLREGEENGISPSAKFNPEYYRLKYHTEIVGAELSPLLHYIIPGKRERKRPIPVADEFQWPEHPPSEERPTVVVISGSHESTERLELRARLISELAKWCEVVVFLVEGQPCEQAVASVAQVTFAYHVKERVVGDLVIDNLEYHYFARRLVCQYKPDFVVDLCGLAPFLYAMQLRLLPTFSVVHKSLGIAVERLGQDQVAVSSSLVVTDENDLQVVMRKYKLAPNMRIRFERISSANLSGETTSDSKFNWFLACHKQELSTAEGVSHSSGNGSGDGCSLAGLASGLILEALHHRKRLSDFAVAVELISKSPEFYQRHYLRPSEPENRLEAIQKFVFSESQHRHSSKRRAIPGFDQRMYAEERESAIPKSEIVLVHYLRSGMDTGRWRKELLLPDANQIESPIERVALHGHLYYPELARNLLVRVAENRTQPKLFLNVVDETTAENIATLCTDLGLTAMIKVFPNRGRDLGPFLTGFRDELFSGDFDIVGHFHSKKSAAATVNLGDAWRTFLLEHLVGGRHGLRMMDNIVGQMLRNPDVGLVYPDDPHYFGWGLNKEIATELADRMFIADYIKAHIAFPAGAMFWLRPQVLKRLLEMEFSWDDYPGEPVPNDGTMLHAIERLLPALAEAEGFKVLQTHVPGLTWSDGNV